MWMGYDKRTMQNTSAIGGSCGDALREHCKKIQPLHIRDMFAADRDRAEKFSVEDCGLLADYSKNRILDETVALLIELAHQAGWTQWRDKLFDGEAVNTSEQRGASHIVMRRPAAGGEHEAGKALSRMRQISGALRRGERPGCGGKPIRDVVCLGIGGSHLGCAMACRAIPPGDSKVRVHFVAGAGAGELDGTLAGMKPDETLFIITSKSFTTWETRANARRAKKWIGGDGARVAKHFIAVSGNAEAAAEFGIAPENHLPLPATIGGRYSLSSAAGLPFAIHAGMDAYEAFLAGAFRMDRHFRNAQARANMPLIMALLDVWYANFFALQSRAVLSYVRRLELFPAYLQQLEMESNGKRVSREAQTLGHATAPVTWGGPALEGQHSFNQLLHQGTQLVPVDFIVSARQGGERIFANFLARSHLLMHGHDDPDPQRAHPGNRPSTTLMMRELDPATLGALVALYEHKVFCAAVVWGVNPFDQWGVAAGKVLADELLAELQQDTGGGSLDGSSRMLLERYKQWR